VATILKFPDVKKFGFKAVKKSKRVDLEKHGQLNLFSSPQKVAKVIQMKSDLSPFEQAMMLDERGESSAKTIYRKAIEENDYVADAYCNLGILESKEGNTGKALDCFAHSLSSDPRHFEAHFNLANLYLDEENLKLAKLHYEAAREIQPDYANLHFNLALVYAMLNQLEDSIQSLKRYKSLTTVSEHKSADELLRNLQLSVTVRN